MDPSTVSTGLALISSERGRNILNRYGLIKLKGSLIKRVSDFYNSILNIFEKYQIDCLALETPFVGRNIATYGKLSMLRGALYILAHRFSIEVIELPPTKVKQLVTFKGNSTKEDVAAMIRKIYAKLPSKLSNDITDAIGIAHAGLIERRYKPINKGEVNGKNKKKNYKKKGCRSKAIKQR